MPPRRPSLAFRHPARAVALAFAGLIVVGTLVLRLPLSAADGHPGWSAALFTATSAVTVTGLIVVDTGTAWSGFGQAVIVLLAQVGGLGVMTLASIVALLVGHRVGLRAAALTRGESGSIDRGELRRVLKGVAAFSVAIEAVTALVLTLRFAIGYDLGPARAAWEGLFTAVMAFNNAGFALAPDNLTPYATDPLVNVVVLVAIVAGGLGFPVLVELWREHRPRRWSLNTRLTLVTTGVLFAVGAVALTAFEWTNSRTLGPLAVPHKLLVGTFQGMTPRTAGFNTVDWSAMREDTWLITNPLMFIGAGAASTGGGIKVTTFAVLVLACWAELRGHRYPHAFGRRLPPEVVRQALTVTLAAMALVGGAATVLLIVTPFLLDRVLFEVISAFGTVGLSTGITGQLGTTGELVLVVMMFLGRVGPATLGAALVLRRRERLYELPEGRPLVG